MELNDPVQFVKGVGPRRAELLSRSGFETIEDLVYHLPFRYEDRRTIVRTDNTAVGGEATLVGKISGVREIRRRGRGGSMLEAVFSDEGGWISLLWFHQAAFFRKKIEDGGQWLVHGRVEAGRRGGLQIIHPEIEAAPDGSEGLARILPVYQKPSDLTVSAMRGFVARAVDGCIGLVHSSVPPSLSQRLGLQDLSEALAYVHSPPAEANIADLQRFATPAHRTLIFEELFTLQVGISLTRVWRESQKGVSLAPARQCVDGFISALPFELTAAQVRVIAEISKDLEAPRPMVRLVHGDVGSGKTVVAFAASLQAVAGGHQVAVMAPTELLAEQHFATMGPWAEALGLRIALLTGSVSAARAREIRGQLSAGSLDLVVGTHALVQDSTGFARLGLAVVDEQHRFGVMQRAVLQSGSANTLMLSATPIPRTLALTLYGDIDVSFLDEMPPGRSPTTTRVIRTSSRGRLHQRMAAAMSSGHQCYVVYPLVEESEHVDLADATSQAEHLQSHAFKDFTVGLVHGRMKGAEKDAVMRSFKEGQINCLVATSVIEVGIDVPQATIIVVEHAERFGLAQLHQLRGRVGRGGGESFCCLVADEAQSVESIERLRVMETTNDGFEIAEADLKLRGPGEYLGTRQSGLPAFRAANLVRDSELLELARREADGWLQRDPGLEDPESAELRRSLSVRWGERLRLAEIG